jgi:23S rRNA pseudouridine955/2504/2580 synthase
MGQFLNTPQVQHITVDDEAAGQRLDNFLFRHLKGVPKTHVYRIIRSGEVRVNKGRASAETKVSAGDVLRVPPLRMAAESELVLSRPHVPAREFPVLFEDDGLLAIHKPAGVAVHGGSGVSSGVIEQLRQARPLARMLELVHRLDRDTSGVLLIAKKRSALRHLQDQFRERETGKTYLALVRGVWPQKHKVIDQALQKYLLLDGERRVRVVKADHPDAMRSVTLVKVHSVVSDPCASSPVAGHTVPGVSLLEVTIKTGRTHQIRVHLSHAGHPIAGDDKYGDYEWNRQLIRAGHSRMFLHAWRLEVRHPVTADALRIIAPVPIELMNMLPFDAVQKLSANPDV